MITKQVATLRKFFWGGGGQNGPPLSLIPLVATVLACELSQLSLVVSCSNCPWLPKCPLLRVNCPWLRVVPTVLGRELFQLSLVAG